MEGSKKKNELQLVWQFFFIKLLIFHFLFTNSPLVITEKYKF